MIYICYGMTKSASTLLYQLTEEILRVAGRSPVRLRPPLRPFGSVANYFDEIDPPLLQEITGRHHGRDVVLKTHQAPHPQIAARVCAGEILASASIRDPREVALSMIDHGDRSRRLGHSEFSECCTFEDVLPSIDNQIEKFRSWSALPPVKVFHYNEICFEQKNVVAGIADQLGVVVDVDRVLEPFIDTRLIGEFNKGVPLRYREMPKIQQEIYLLRYAQLYRDYEFHTPMAIQLAQRRTVIRPRSQFGHFLTDARRFFHK
jgi:hypothetical protein